MVGCTLVGKKRQRPYDDPVVLKPNNMKEISETITTLKNRSHEIASIVPQSYADFVADALARWNNNLFFFGLALKKHWSSKEFYESPLIDTTCHSADIPDLPWLAEIGRAHV